MLRFIDWAILRRRCQLCMWILHMEFKDEIEIGHQNFNFLIIHLKQLKLTLKYVVLLRSKWKKHNKALNSACNIFLLSEPKIVTKHCIFYTDFCCRTQWSNKIFYYKIYHFCDTFGLPEKKSIAITISKSYYAL